MTDGQLLQRFAASRDEEAFAELVRRYSGLVHATALRLLRDDHLAEDATQAVFLVLAQKAGNLSPQTVLSGWLYTAAWNAARNLGRAAARRAAGERRAGMAKEATAQDESERLIWDDAKGQLDGALHELSEPLRQAIVLRCFLQQTPEDCARSAGVSEKAFSMRLSRGLDALRQKLTRRGVTLGSVILADLLARHAPATAPQTLQHALVATALGKAAATQPALFTAKGVLHAMFWTKTKVAVLTALAAVFLCSSVAVAYRYTASKPAVPPSPTVTARAADVPPTSPAPPEPVQPPAAEQSATPQVVSTPVNPDEVKINPDEVKITRIDREPGQKKAAPPPASDAAESTQALNRACDEISKVMGKQDTDWALAKPNDARLPENVRKLAYIGLPGNLQTVTVHPNHRYWITAIGIDLKDPSKSIWWEFDVTTNSVTQRIREPLTKLAHVAGAQPDNQIEVQPAKAKDASEF